MKEKDFYKEIKDTKKAKEFFLEQLSFTINPDMLNKALNEYIDDIYILDVRDYENYIKGHIPYAVHIPMEQIEEHMKNLSKDKITIVYTYCPLCYRAKKAAYILADNGYPVMELTGGFKGWKKRDFDIIENDMSDYPG